MKKLCLSLLMTMLLTTSCASPYIGRTVNLSAPSVCRFDMLPTTCSWITTDFTLDYEISEKGYQLYEIKGVAKKNNGTSGTFTDYSGATFTLILIENGVVVETVTIAGGAGSFDSEISFKREFSTETSFEATILTYSMQARG